MTQKQPSLKPLQIELRQAMADWGCPLCRLSQKAEHAFVESLNYERVLDLSTRDALKASRGLCEAHSRDWREVQGSALGIAIVYRVTLLDLLRDTSGLEEAQGSFMGLGRGDLARKASEALEAETKCPACQIGEDTAERFADLLLEDLGDGDFRELLRDCGGLCLPHLRMTLNRRVARRKAAILIDLQRHAWRDLMEELEEFIRKNDYRFQDETMTQSEETSWTRVLDAIVGLER